MIRLNIINGVRLLNFEHKSLFLPSDEDPSNENLHNIFLKANRRGRRLSLLLFQILRSGVLCLVLGRLCSAESLVFVESGNEIPENAMAFACSAAICGVPVHLSNPSSSGISTRTTSEFILEVREMIVHSIDLEAVVVDVTDI